MPNASGTIVTTNSANVTHGRDDDPPTLHDVEATGRASPTAESSPRATGSSRCHETVVRRTRRAHARRAAAPMRSSQLVVADESARSLPALRRRRGDSPRSRSRRRRRLRASRRSGRPPPARRTRPPRGTRSRSPRPRARSNDRDSTSRTRRPTRRARAGRRRRPARGTARCRPRASRAGAGRGRRPRSRAGRRSEPEIASMTTSNPCGEPAATPRARAAGRDRARSAGGSRRACRPSIGTKRSPSTPGGMRTPASGRPTALSASRAGYVPAATTAAAPRSTRRASPRLPGDSRVAGDLAAVGDDDVRRRGQVRADQPDRQHRIEEDHVGARPRARARRSRRVMARRRQQHLLARSLDCGRPGGRPIRPRPDRAS